MDNLFADRVADVPRSFIREILKVAFDPSVISFAGGLPNRDLFPVRELKEAAIKAFDTDACDMLQYRSSEGHLGLRRTIAERYVRRYGLDVRPENVLITSGSQQGMDLLGKVLLNEGDEVIIEQPSYLGAIQVLSGYRAVFHPVPVTEEGVDLPALQQILVRHKPKLMYGVPNFQNPAGISYSLENRRRLAAILQETSTIFVEDDPYSELRFAGTPKPPLKQLMPDSTVLLGSFSKIVAPGFRVGWLVAPDRMMEKLVIAKQAADLHSSSVSQYVIHQYLMDNDIDRHIREIVAVYGRLRQAMLDRMQEYFPRNVHTTRPEGGMFLWVSLPEHASATALFDLAIRDRVAFVPGDPFYVRHAGPVNTLRLSFSCVSEEMIDVGIRRLGDCIRKLIGRE